MDEAGLRGFCRFPGGRDWFLPTDGCGWVLSLWWAGLCQEVCLAGSCGLRKTFGSLSADGWGCVPTLSVLWPEVSPHWSLEGVGWGQVLVRKWRPLGGPTPMSTPQNYRHLCFCPCSEPQLLPTSTGDSPIPAGRSGPRSCELTAFSLGSWYAQDLVCAKSGVSVSPSPVEFLQSNTTGAESQMLWGLLLPLPDPKAGDPDVGLRTFTPMR